MSAQYPNQPHGRPAGGPAPQQQRPAPNQRPPVVKDKKGPTPRSASTLRWLALGFAGVLSVLVVVVVTSSDPSTYVVRSTAELQSMSTVPPERLEAVSLPEDAVEPDAFTGSTAQRALDAATDYVDGQWLLSGVSAQQQLRPSMFGQLGELAEPLAPDERLLSISARASSAVAGTVRSGDRVDIYATSADGLTGVIGQGVEVVGISIQPDQFESLSSQQLSDPDSSFDDLAPHEPVPGTYVLRVSADDIGRYLAADVGGELHLTLRGPDADDLAPGTFDLLGTICGFTPNAAACVRTGQDFDEVRAPWLPDPVSGTTDLQLDEDGHVLDGNGNQLELLEDYFDELERTEDGDIVDEDGVTYDADSLLVELADRQDSPLTGEGADAD